MYFTLFFFNDTATTEIYTLSLHDALPICARGRLAVLLRVERERVAHDLRVRLDVALRAGQHVERHLEAAHAERADDVARGGDRKSTRLNSSHANISYAVFCLKKKNINHAF